AVALGGVDEVAAQVQRAVQRRDRIRVLLRAPASADGPGAKADLRNLPAGPSERAVFHGRMVAVMVRLPMADLFADRLLEAIADKGSPICVGIDPIYEMLPDAVGGPANRRDANDAAAAVDAIFAFTIDVLKTVAPLVPCVKFQSAYFEKYLWEGVEAYYSLIQEAKELGLIVIGDVKRGDI